MDIHQSLAINRAGWDSIAAQFHGSVLPRYGPLAQSETDLHLIEPLQGARVLEMGCGSGQSLLYLAHQGAGELWGLDFSSTQLELASNVLKEYSLQSRLFESPMEENPGLPLGYFDFVISIYGLGWSVDLPRTLRHIASYLKPNGCLVLSWEHPVYSCLEYDAGQYVFKRSYHHEGAEYKESWKGVPIVAQHRKLATFLNGLIDAGLVVERFIESELDTTVMKEHNRDPEYWYAVQRAELMPTTMIIKARKQGERVITL